MSAIEAVRARRRRSTRSTRRLATHIVLLAIGALWLFPVLWAFSGSLKSSDAFLNSGLSLATGSPHWGNYATAWHDAGMSGYFVNSVVITTLTVVFTMLFTSAAGFALARTDFPGRKLLLGVVAVTFFLPRGYTIVPVYDLVDKLGLLNSVFAVILVQVAYAMVFSTFMFMGYFRTVTNEIVEAAWLDGANFHQVFFRIALPLARPMVATLGLFTFIGSWNDFMTPLVFTLGKPELRTVSVGLYSYIGQTSTDWTSLCASAVISLAPIVIVFVFAQRHIVSAIAGAVKG